jgi:hypothetical protein
MLRRITLAAGVAAALWGFLILLAHGGQVQFLGLKLSSRHPLLLFWGGVALLGVHAWLSKPAFAALKGPRDTYLVASRLASLSAAQASLATAVVAILAGAASVHWGSTVVGGADSYGYLSQAGLWQQGELLIHGDVIRQSPWPLAFETWAPLGYRPAAGRINAVAPLYPPGLPLMMALFQRLFGYCGAFFIVPISAASAVALTFVLGLRVFPRPAPALWAALLVAASPVFLFQSMNPMTDVPVVAAWTLVLVLAVADWPLAAGVAMAIALSIRPNLVLVAGAVLVWTALTDWRVWRSSIGHVPTRTLRLAIGVAPAIIGIAWFNTYLYGSPLVSGYGSLGYLYALSHVWKNVSQFTTSMFETQTPIVLASVLFFVAPRWMGDARIPFPRLLFGAVMLSVVLSYLLYIPFEGWTYLRFLLPMWPVLMLSAAFGLDAASRRWRSIPGTAVALPQLLALACVALALWRGVGIAEDRGTFDLWRGERKYADVGRYLADHTDPRAAILTFQHSGSIRLYADRLTMRWDQLDVAWLDRAVEHLASIGRHPYIVVDGDERQLFRELFGTLNRLGGLEWTPMAVLQHPPVTIFDAADRRARQTDLITESGRGPAGWRCTPPQRWPTPLRME